MVTDSGTVESVMVVTAVRGTRVTPSAAVI